MLIVKLTIVVKKRHKNPQEIKEGMVIKMKKISLLIPTFNEEENVRELAGAIVDVFKRDLADYRYEIVFIDNASTDGTRRIISDLCNESECIKAIFNAKNFGQFNSPYYGLCQTTGDCTILMCADFQDPVDMIPVFVSEWEKGHKIVCGIKVTSRENGLVRFLRTCYYKLIKKFSTVNQIEHFTGFGLYDASFIDVMRKLDDPMPFLRGIVAELGTYKEIPYEQQRRKAGKTKNNWLSLYDAAMLAFTSYTKAGLRVATFLGAILSLAGFLVATVYLILKLIFWNTFAAGMAPILIGVFLFSSVQIFFIGLLGEYIMSINSRILHRPLVIEEKRINFDDEAGS